MRREEIEKTLRGIQGGDVSVDEALRQLVGLSSSADLGHSTIDLAREARCGHAEVVYGAGKTPSELLEVSNIILESHSSLLVTRANKEGSSLLQAELPNAVFHERSGCVTVGSPADSDLTGLVTVVSAGTSDGAIAEEASVTARFLGARVEEVRDVGVAGLHRLLDHAELLQSARCVIVVAGMEGALPSVVGGLVASPVIAVPTSVGYGAAFGGIAALLGMLNSCAAGVTVVNIDNGFGAGYSAALINSSSTAAERGDSA